MKIRDRIMESKKNRLKRLKELSAPKSIIEALESQINSGELNVEDKLGLLDNELVSWEELTGRGGKIYYVINENIGYWPNGRYGAFISYLSK